MTRAHESSSLLTEVASIFDHAVMYGMRLAFGSTLFPAPDELETLKASAKPYCTASLRRLPEAFFRGAAALETPVVVGETARARSGDAWIVRRFFESAYVPFAGSAEGCAENERVWFDHWMHESSPSRPTLLALHGLGMGWPKLDARMLMAERWFALGLDVALITLPFHGARASRACRFSGEEFATWHVGRLNEAVRQSVFDALRLALWLEQETRQQVGVLGLSLGGYIAALLAELKSDLAFAIPIVPPVCLADLPHRLFEGSRRARSGEAPPVARAHLRRSYRVHSPLTYPLAVPRERVFIVGGKGDQITPVRHAWALWKHWGEPAAAWYTGGHVAAFHRGHVAAEIERHLRRLGVIAPKAHLTAVQ